MQLSQKLKLKQELKQRIQLKQQLQLYLPPEFSEYLNIEKDEDIELLRRSVAFLSLHEFSHPLYDRGKVIIPGVENPSPLVEKLGLYDHNAIETGIDKSAMLLGPTQDITTENMYVSHTAMMQRVFRDHFELRKREIDPSLLARFYCEIKDHSEQTQDDLLRKKLEGLIVTADKEIPGIIEKDHFQKMLDNYSRIYRETELNI